MRINAAAVFGRPIFYQHAVGECRRRPVVAEKAAAAAIGIVDAVFQFLVKRPGSGVYVGIDVRLVVADGAAIDYGGCAIGAIDPTAIEKGDVVFDNTVADGRGGAADLDAGSHAFLAAKAPGQREAFQDRCALLAGFEPGTPDPTDATTTEETQHVH